MTDRSRAASDGQAAAPDLVAAAALAGGATAAALFDVSKVVLRDEVRDMCLADRCRQCGRNWMCPPGVGPLEHWREVLRGYASGLLIQYTGELDDAFDVEAMTEAEKRLKNVFRQLRRQFPPERSGLLYLTAGACDLCPDCTYPGAPCRLPAQAGPSLEAVGIVVTELCELAGLPYYYGANTLTFSGAVLFRR